MAVDRIEDSLELLDIFLGYSFIVIREHHHDPAYSQADADAKIIHQMIFTKATHLRKIIEGVGFSSQEGIKLNPIIDPTIVASLVRNIYETVCLFNLIYISTSTKDEKRIIYYLWVISGLQYRQRFSAIATIPSNIEKVQSEAKAIENLVKKIEDTELYKKLTPQNQNKIKSKIKEKDYKITFENENVKFLTWQDISKIMGKNHPIFENIYTYFSLYSHPSHVSVFQFADMFNKEGEPFKRLVSSNMKYCFTLLSIFTADYLKLFPNIKETYENQSLVSQIMLNFHNKLIRGDEYSVSNAWKNLE